MENLLSVGNNTGDVTYVLAISQFLEKWKRPKKCAWNLESLKVTALQRLSGKAFCFLQPRPVRALQRAFVMTEREGQCMEDRRDTLSMSICPKAVSQAHFIALRTEKSCLMRTMAMYSLQVCHFCQTCTLNWCCIQESVMIFRTRTQSQATVKVGQRFNKSVTHSFLGYSSQSPN